MIYKKTAPCTDIGAGDEEGYGDLDEAVVKDEQEIRQAEKSADEGKGTLDHTPSFYLVLTFQQFQVNGNVA